MTTATPAPPMVELSPTQKRTLEVMGQDEHFQRVGARRTHDAELPERLRAELEVGLRPVVDTHSFTPKDSLWVKKWDLSSVFKCEGLYKANVEDTSFEWDFKKARGTILHKAMEGGLTPRGQAMPSPQLAQAAVDRLRNGDDFITSWLQERTDFEIEELISDATDSIVKFRGDWPRLDVGWQPRVESSLTIPLLSGAIVLKGKVDLALGMPQGQEARTFISDLKTGTFHSEHMDDLRFYALLETLRSKVPPFRVAGYYLDGGDWRYEDVNEDTLRAAVRRVVEGVTRMAPIYRREDEGDLTLTPGPVCTFCPAKEDCFEGQAYLADRADRRGELN